MAVEPPVPCAPKNRFLYRASSAGAKSVVTLAHLEVLQDDLYSAIFKNSNKWIDSRVRGDRCKRAVGGETDNKKRSSRGGGRFQKRSA
jgi:hypothetical protein